MQKPDSLRKRLVAAFPDLDRNPDRLLVFVDAGRVIGTATAARSFELQYTLNLILTDFSGDPDAVMLAVVDWVQVNQSELLANNDQRRDAIQFEADILSNTLCDLSIKLPLTERVLASKVDGQWATTDASEPALVESDWDHLFGRGHGG